MNPRTVEYLILAFVPLAIVCVVVGLIMAIFMLSGHEELLTQMLQATARGELSGVAFTAGGPFAMWIAAFVLFRHATKGAPPGSVRLNLHFAQDDRDLQSPPPSEPAHFHRSTCWYSVFSGDQKVDEDKKVTVHTDQVDRGHYVPYIYVEVPKIEDPLFQVRLEYGGREWISDSYSPRKGVANLR